jgi:hypothetical protein
VETPGAGFLLVSKEGSAREDGEEVVVVDIGYASSYE